MPLETNEKLSSPIRSRADLPNASESGQVCLAQRRSASPSRATSSCHISFASIPSTRHMFSRLGIWEAPPWATRRVCNAASFTPTCPRIRASLPCVTRQPNPSLESSGLVLGFGAGLPRAVGQWVMASVLRVYRHAPASIEALKPLNRHLNCLPLVRQLPTLLRRTAMPNILVCVRLPSWAPRSRTENGDIYISQAARSRCSACSSKCCQFFS
jgi:hypothetical protein